MGHHGKRASLQYEILKMTRGEKLISEMQLDSSPGSIQGLGASAA